VRELSHQKAPRPFGSRIALSIGNWTLRCSQSRLNCDSPTLSSNSRRDSSRSHAVTTSGSARSADIVPSHLRSASNSARSRARRVASAGHRRGQQQWQRIAHGQRDHVLLDRGEGVLRMVRLGLQQRADALVAIRHRPFARDEVRVVVAHDLLVGRDDHALGRIEAARQLLERNETLPVVARIPARRWREPHQVIVRARRRHAARRDIADIAVDVGIDDVLLRRMKSRSAATNDFQSDACSCSGWPRTCDRRPQRRPLERHHVLRAQRLGGRADRLRHIGHHRSVARAAHRQRDIGAP
jgi:hypothetical protein